MRTLVEVLEQLNRADVFGTPVESVHTERGDGETPLHLFSKWGDAEAIQVLIAGGADLNKLGEDGNTPLHYAAMFGHLSAVQTLVALRAVNIRDRYGNLPVDLARDHPAVHEFLKASDYAV
jgi:uncharacterized protein